jgi:hypothetical protein
MTHYVDLVNQIRKLRENGCQRHFILNEPGIGYRFVDNWGYSQPLLYAVTPPTPDTFLTLGP